MTLTFVSQIDILKMEYLDDLLDCSVFGGVGLLFGESASSSSSQRISERRLRDEHRSAADSSRLREEQRSMEGSSKRREEDCRADSMSMRRDDRCLSSSRRGALLFR